MGVVPLAFSSGAGAIARQIMGTAVMGGTITASVIAILLIPVTFYVVAKISERGKKDKQAEEMGREHA
jgi:HAE1 family hydrophobic/amphiphilic exporter-1